jgi:hypothetical protein
VNLNTTTGRLHEDALTDLWNGAIDGVEFADRLRRLDAAAK